MTKPPPNFMWPVIEGSVRVLDGDTVEVVFDLGVWEKRLRHIRLEGIDTPESFRPKSQHKELEKRVGVLVKCVVEEWIHENENEAECRFYGTSTKKPKYAKRSIGSFYAQSQDDESVTMLSLGDYLLGLGLAKPYQGGKRDWTEDELRKIEALALKRLDEINTSHL